ncbi:MAG: 1,4-dihydroxy-2-naphthoate polyprenyltransferase [Spirochaetaceae bacterium]|jgi:1,4-dihydroxy-2-naphthoate octaprenyltransferase|nr:1,4-dihydroxy-2-naphthoate polyprenyltransferase [Spirochaetaceae bacterium]
MKLQTFFKLVEIQTKIASLFPFIFGTLYALYRFGKLDWISMALYFSSLLLFDMATTTINNYMDYRKAKDEQYRKEHNIIGIAGIKESTVVLIILILLVSAFSLGILLFFKTGPLVLLLGGMSFFVGIFYTFGPIPISRMPLGEVLSGVFMGFIIPYLAVFIHEPSIGVIEFIQGKLSIHIDLMETLYIAIISAPFVLAISNLMLANNICDLEQDKKNDRYLLPYYLGVKNSLWIFRWSYHVMYLFIILAVGLKILPWLTLLCLPVSILHYRLGKAFTLNHVKVQTFVLSVKGLRWISMSYIGAMGLGLIFRRFLS